MMPENWVEVISIGPAEALADLVGEVDVEALDAAAGEVREGVGGEGAVDGGLDRRLRQGLSGHERREAGGGEEGAEHDGNPLLKDRSGGGRGQRNHALFGTSISSTMNNQAEAV
jgi:hypothetical protein